MFLTRPERIKNCWRRDGKYVDEIVRQGLPSEIVNAHSLSYPDTYEREDVCNDREQ